MKSHLASTQYFSETGTANTEETMHLARAHLEALGLATVLVATTNGDAGVQAVKIFQGCNLICVSHAAGFKGPDTQELTPQNREIITAAGVPIVTAAHAFAGISRAIRGKFNTYETVEIMANTLRLFGEGMKVAVEITLMASDAGVIHMDTPVLAIAGTEHGADTAVLLKPAGSHSFFDLKIIEIICMPSPFHPAFNLSH